MVHIGQDLCNRRINISESRAMLDLLVLRLVRDFSCGWFRGKSELNRATAHIIMT